MPPPERCAAMAWDRLLQVKCGQAWKHLERNAATPFTMGRRRGMCSHCFKKVTHAAKLAKIAHQKVKILCSKDGCAT